MRLRKRRNSSGGFTLVELIVSVAVLFILLAGILTIIMPGFRFFGTMDKITSAKMISNTLYGYIEDRVRYATELTLGSGGGSEILRVEDGRLTDSAGQAPSEDFYDGMTVEITFGGSRSWLLSVAIAVLDQDGEVIHTQTNTVRLVNLELAAKEISGSADDAVSFSLAPPT